MLRGNNTAGSGRPAATHAGPIEAAKPAKSVTSARTNAIRGVASSFHDARSMASATSSLTVWPALTCRRRRPTLRVGRSEVVSWFVIVVGFYRRFLLGVDCLVHAVEGGVALAEKFEHADPAGVPAVGGSLERSVLDVVGLGEEASHGSGVVAELVEPPQAVHADRTILVRDCGNEVPADRIGRHQAVPDLVLEHLAAAGEVGTGVGGDDDPPVALAEPAVEADVERGLRWPEAAPGDHHRWQEVHDPADLPVGDPVDRVVLIQRPGLGVLEVVGFGHGHVVKEIATQSENRPVGWSQARTRTS